MKEIDEFTIQAMTIAVLLRLANENIPIDMQELLMHGNPRMNVKPGVIDRICRDLCK